MYYYKLELQCFEDTIYTFPPLTLEQATFWNGILNMIIGQLDPNGDLSTRIVRDYE